ncbi:MAG TPA: cupin domain-containing protein [bacterium]|nr:cupin domain-containing protein [bacterium]
MKPTRQLGELKKSDAVKIATGKALRLSELIEYQADAVVSREVLKNKAGTLTVFAFAAGQGLSEHTAPFDAVVEVLDGEAEITVGGRKAVARAGETVIMPANVPHALRAGKRFKMLLIMIKGS